MTHKFANVILGFITGSSTHDLFDASKALQALKGNLSKDEYSVIDNAIDEADSQSTASDDLVADARRILKRVAKSTNEGKMRITKRQLVKMIREAVEYESKFDKSVKGALDGVHAAMNILGDERDPLFQRLEDVASDLTRILKGT